MKVDDTPIVRDSADMTSVSLPFHNPSLARILVQLDG